jgi:metal-responsive CopG/Arc/MetJ family transcriptional regulator
MALPPPLPRGKASHKLEVRVNRYLWHEFLEACKASGYRNASEALREAMRTFIRASRKRVVVLGAKKKKPRN